MGENLADKVLDAAEKHADWKEEWSDRTDHLKEDLETCIPQILRSRVKFLENDCKDIWDWSEKVYRIIENEV